MSKGPETVSHRKAAKLLGVNPRTVLRMVNRGALQTVRGEDGKNYILRSSLSQGNTATTATEMDKFMDLLQKAGVSPEEVGSVTRVKHSQWQGMLDGEVVDLEATSVVLSPSWESGPEYPVVNQAPAREVNKKLKRYTALKRKRAVILPDVQIGYRRDMVTDKLDPFHDETAIDVALQITQQFDPDLIVNIGDFLDFPEFGKYQQEPAFQRTTQAAINRGYDFLCEQKANAPRADIKVFEGNHDRRIQNKIVDHAMNAFGIQKAKLPDSWPVLSVPYLLRFEELGVEYLGGYPANSYWVNDRLVVVHGNKVRSNGSTAMAEVDDERVSVIFGHIHRIEQQYKTRNVRGGYRINSATSPGCLCRIDGTVPSTKGSVDEFGRPMTRYENWQQGIALVEYEEGDGPFSIEVVPIFDGVATWRGNTYKSEDVWQAISR